jgi:hypothetical protein
MSTLRYTADANRSARGALTPARFARARSVAGCAMMLLAAARSAPARPSAGPATAYGPAAPPAADHDDGVGFGGAFAASLLAGSSVWFLTQWLDKRRVVRRAVHAGPGSIGPAGV